jgi:hypothetical protein
MADPTFVAGKWLVLKDPDDIRYYKFGFAKDLTDSSTTPHATRPPTAILAGVALATHPDALPNLFVQGTDVYAFLGGMDVTTTSALNFCTIRLPCANGEQIDRTMWFVREDH